MKETGVGVQLGWYRVCPACASPYVWSQCEGNWKGRKGRRKRGGGEKGGRKEGGQEGRKGGGGAPPLGAPSWSLASGFCREQLLASHPLVLLWVLLSHPLVTPDSGSHPPWQRWRRKSRSPVQHCDVHSQRHHCTPVPSIHPQNHFISPNWVPHLYHWCRTFRACHDADSQWQHSSHRSRVVAVTLLHSTLIPLWVLQLLY